MNLLFSNLIGVPGTFTQKNPGSCCDVDDIFVINASIALNTIPNPDEWELTLTLNNGITVVTSFPSAFIAAAALNQVLIVGNKTLGKDIMLSTGDALSTTINGNSKVLKLFLDIASSTVDKLITISETAGGFSITDSNTNGINSNSIEFTITHKDGRIISFKGSDSNKHTFDMSANTANRNYTLQDASGTLAFLSDIAGGVRVKGDYNATTNTPDLDTTPSGILQGDLYVVTVAGTFFATPVAVGDMLIAKINNAAAEVDWIIVEHNLQDATTTIKGIVALATTLEVSLGIDNTKAITPLALKDGGYVRELVQGGTTSDATPLLLVGSEIIASNTVKSFSSIVTATEIATGDVSVWKYKGAIKNLAGTTTLVDTVVSEEIAEDVGALSWGVIFIATDTSDTLDITVTGEALHILKWTAETTFNEVSL